MTGQCPLGQDIVLNLEGVYLWDIKLEDSHDLQVCIPLDSMRGRLRVYFSLGRLFGEQDILVPKKHFPYWKWV